MRRVLKNRKDTKKKKMEKFGIEIPRNVRHALILDGIIKNKVWTEAITKEMAALEKSNVF